MRDSKISHFGQDEHESLHPERRTSLRSSCEFDPVSIQASRNGEGGRRAWILKELLIQELLHVVVNK